MINQQPQDGQQITNIDPASRKSLQSEKQPKLRKIKTRTTIVEQREDEDLVYEKIKDSRFKQQRLPAWRPVPTIMSIIIVFSVFGILFLILGIVLLVYSSKVKSIELRYDDKCNLDTSCTVNETIKEKIEKPVFFYYQLDGFFQNSRRYVKSKEVAQLTGDKPYSKENCDPVETNEEMGFSNETKSMNNETYLNPSDIAIPCGLMAKTFFNDNFSFFIIAEKEEINVDQKNIAFDKDKKLYSKEPDPSHQWTNITDEHFLVWMRPSGLPNPRKLWGRINRDLKKGEIIDVTINNKYYVSHYRGKKKLVLRNATKFGGKNKFLGISYLVVGILSILCAIFFPIGYKFQMQKEKYL